MSNVVKFGITRKTSIKQHNSLEEAISFLKKDGSVVQMVLENIKGWVSRWVLLSYWEHIKWWGSYTCIINVNHKFKHLDESTKNNLYSSLVKALDIISPGWNEDKPSFLWSLFSSGDISFD